MSKYSFKLGIFSCLCLSLLSRSLLFLLLEFSLFIHPLGRPYAVLLNLVAHLLFEASLLIVDLARQFIRFLVQFTDLSILIFSQLLGLQADLCGNVGLLLVAHVSRARGRRTFLVSGPLSEGADIVQGTSGTDLRRDVLSHDAILI